MAHKRKRMTPDDWGVEFDYEGWAEIASWRKKIVLMLEYRHLPDMEILIDCEIDECKQDEPDAHFCPDFKMKLISQCDPEWLACSCRPDLDMYGEPREVRAD